MWFLLGPPGSGKGIRAKLLPNAMLGIYPHRYLAQKSEIKEGTDIGHHEQNLIWKKEKSFPTKLL
jgi:adenylate kinase family enzyme